MNYNSEIITSDGKFIIQVIGSEYNTYKESRMKTEFLVLNHLKERKFPYEIPLPIKSNNGSYIFQLGNNYLWAYKMIEGDTYRKLNLDQFKQTAISLAEYHKCVKGLSSDSDGFFNLDWLLGKYAQMKEIKPKNRIDKLMNSNLSLFESIIANTNKLDFKVNTVFTHSDFHNGNILFRQGKLAGIIDFDNIAFAPRINDISIAIRRLNYIKIGFSRKKSEIFLKKYQEVCKLSTKEKSLIIPAMIRGNCISFWWVYAEMKKNRNNRYDRLEKIITETKKLMKEPKLD